MGKLQKLFKFFIEKRFLYFLWGSKVTIEKGGFFKVGKNVTIKNTKIYVKKGDALIIGNNTRILSASISMIVGKPSKIHIGDNCLIDRFRLSLTGGDIHIGDFNILDQGHSSTKPYFEVEGELKLGNYNRLSCSTWIRFGGCVDIGSRNAINKGTEIRSDEKITIKDYNQISYDCAIWDTNTHNIYVAQNRREITDSQYPVFGLEFEKPKTLPITIGSDCWIGKGVTILKGTDLGNKCIVGYGALLSNISVPENKTIINQPNLKLLDNQI